MADPHRGMASQASHSEGLWKNHTECHESTDTHKVLRTHSSGIRKLQVSVQLCWLPKGCRGRPPSSQSPSSGKASASWKAETSDCILSNNPPWSKFWDGNLLHLENQRWFCYFLFQQSREENIDRKHRTLEELLPCLLSHRWPIIHQRVTSLRLPRGSGCF